MQYYDIAALEADLQVLRQSGAKVFSIGKTLLGRDIWCVFKGNVEGAQMLFQGAMHAREYPTTPLLIEMLKNYNGNVGMWCVPMVNPDGVMLCQYGLQSVDDAAVRDFLLEVNGGSQDFSQWKANARAVDINVNFNADWGSGVQNVRYPAPANYIGEYPESEAETLAMVQLTLRVQPEVTLSYHTKGDVIYWGFRDIKPYYELTTRLSDATGYPLLESQDSAGGYKDWFVLTTSKAGVTIEVGDAQLPTPIPLEQLPTIYAANSTVPNVSAGIASEIWSS